MSDVIELKHGQAKDTSCQIRLYGATIVDWIVEGVQHLFVSSKAVLDGSKAIRGGIPICFPIFGAPAAGNPGLQQHGFARTSTWKIHEAPSTEKNGDVTVILSLEDDEESRKVWNHSFLFLYKVTLGCRELSLSVDIQNNGTHDLDFTFALHTYFKVPDVSNCKVTNLTGLTYVDKTQGGKKEVEKNDKVQLVGFTDRVYLDSPDLCELEGLADGRCIKLSKDNIVDTVLWNPWAENAAKMSDFEDSEYKNMICVEAVQHSKPAIVPAGQHWKATHVLAVKD